MKHYTEFNKNNLPELKFLKTNKSIGYANIEAGFDIETTSTILNGNKIAFSYIWMLGIGHDYDVYYGRTLEEFVEFTNTLSKEFDLDEDRLLVLYVHNFAYEFQFIRKYFEWNNVFSIKERKPIKAATKNGIEFRDSLILSGKSLKKTGEDLTKYKVNKIGDFNYDLIRTHETPLTDEEMEYCKNDIRVITAYIKEQIEIEGNITKIPTTNTSRVRRYVRRECYNSSKGRSVGKYNRYRAIMNDLVIGNEYQQLKRAFQGGFTHASHSKVNRVIENVSSYDLSSSYPTVMVTEEFPMSKAFDLKVNSIDELIELSKQYCLLFDVVFYNIYNKFEHESYISESKCIELEEEMTFNGRVFSAKKLVTTLTDVDFKIIQQVYDWEKISIGNLKGYRKGRLPKSIVESILDLYKKKTELKDIKGMETEYDLSKNMLNSVYGMTVTDVITQGAHVYENNWITKYNDENEEIIKHNASRNRFLFYPWGVWITAYARRNLWTAIINIGHDYCYADTDAIKFTNEKDHLPFINAYNKMVSNKVERTIKELKLDDSYIEPKNNNGEIKQLGVFEKDGEYDKFKTLGAKKYMFKTGEEYELVLAGLGKDHGMDYLKKIGKGIEKEIFNNFNNDLRVPKEHTGNLNHIYIDEEMTALVTDYLGNKTIVNPKSSIYLEKSDFTLSESAVMHDFLTNLKNGHVFKRVI